LELFRCQDIAALAIGIAEQGDARGTIRIVLNGLDLCRDLELVTLEID
jgi:hypothetical protein